MISQIDTQDETYQFFIQESLELLQRLEEGLLTISQEHSTKKIHGLMRAAHSIKGGASCVGLTDIQTLAHQLENSFRALYKKDIEFDRELEDLLLQAYDCLRSPLVEQINTEKCSPENSLKKIASITTQLETKLGHSLEEETELPEVEMDIDITQFLFTEEIAQGLNHWEKLLDNPPTPQLVEELKAQAEVFASLGELIDLPSFINIAKTTISALQINPSQAIPIGKLAAGDFRVVQAAVLKGENLPEFSVSTQLEKLARSKLKSSKNPSLLPEKSPSLLEDLESVSRELYPQLSASSLLEDLEKSSPQLASRSESSLFETLENGFDRKADEPPKNLVKNGVRKGPNPASQPEIEIVREPSQNIENKFNSHDFHQPQIIEQVAAPPPKQEPVQITRSLNDSNPSSVLKEQKPKLGVRVDVDRLELLNNLVGDLVTQENSFLLQQQQNKEILDAIAQRLNRFNKLTRSFQVTSETQIVRGVDREISQLAKGMKGKINAKQLLLQNLKSKIQNWEAVAEEIAQLQEAIQDIALTQQQVQQLIEKRQKTLKYVQNNLLQARMLPLGDLLNQFPRMVRDFAVKNNKQVNLQLLGMSTLVDKAILQKLYDPAIQMVRNAFDHGIETPEVRQANGKSQIGTITIRAYHRGNNTYIEFQDDGRGIDLKKIIQRIIELNWLPASEAESLPKNRLYEYLFTPGFSTASKASELSGRGVGLDAVQLQVRDLKGSIDVVSEPGKGTTFILQLPFTLTITRLLVFSIKSNLMAIPVDTLVAIASAAKSEIETHRGEEFYPWKGQLIPIYPDSLLSAYNYPWKPPITEQRSNSSLWQDTGKIPLLLISGGNQIIALKIDRILMEQDLTIKPFTDAMMPPSYLYGCTILGDGRLVPTIDGPRLAAWFQQKKNLPANAISIAPLMPDGKSISRSPMATILIVDDSLTMRKSLSLTLSKAGYQVIQAKNGWEAIEQLRRYPDIKAAISDVEMPQMNGFEFLNRCRKEFSDRNLPVIMLTSRSSEKYRLLAQKLGSSAYLTKPYLDKKLLTTLQQCLVISH